MPGGFGDLAAVHRWELEDVRHNAAYLPVELLLLEQLLDALGAEHLPRVDEIRYYDHLIEEYPPSCSVAIGRRCVDCGTGCYRDVWGRCFSSLADAREWLTDY